MQNTFWLFCDFIKMNLTLILQSFIKSETLLGLLTGKEIGNKRVKDDENNVKVNLEIQTLDQLFDSFNVKIHYEDDEEDNPKLSNNDYSFIYK